jgi:hypothetical protein
MSQGTQSSSGSLPTTNTDELAGHVAPAAPATDASAAATLGKAPVPHEPGPHEPVPHENGGRGGLDPTRYGDWEKNGRCIDF